MAVVPLGFEQMHRKGYEWVQAAYGCMILGCLRDGAAALGVGAGHEPFAYWLAERGLHVTATDLYEGAWAGQGAREGDERVIAHPWRFAPFPMGHTDLTFQRMDGRYLSFADDSFDLVFSLSSIEHFGSKDDASQSVCEMARVLRPGGWAIIATECVLNGFSHPAYFSPRELAEGIVAPSGLILAQSVDMTGPRALVECPVLVPDHALQAPHLSVTDGACIWTSIVLFLTKPGASRDGPLTQTSDHAFQNPGGYRGVSCCCWQSRVK